MKKPNIPWRRITAEGIAIVFSILLAFTIQAWWEGTLEDEKRNVILVGLQGDLEQSNAQLSRLARLDSIRSDAAQRIVGIARTDAVSSSFAAKVDTLLSNAFWGERFEPANGTLDALIGAGSLELLANPTLAADLTSWRSQVESLRASQTQLLSHLNEYVLPYLRTNQIRTADLLWTNAEIYEVPWEVRHTNAYRLIGEPKFESLIADLWFYSSDVTEKSRLVSEKLDRIQLSLAQELGSGDHN